MLGRDLRDTIFLGRHSTQELTPQLVAEKFRGCYSSRISWPPEAILSHTMPGTDNHKYRADLTPDDVLTRFEQKIDSITEGDHAEGPYPPEAHLIIYYVKDDERLNILPAYIHSRFTVSKNKGDLREATYLFQSTELSELHRAVFTPEDIADLFRKCLDAKDYDSLVEIYKTTENAPEYRSCITPKMAKTAFKLLRENYQNSDDESLNHSYYAHKALQMLRFTIGDQTLRSPQGISGRQINSLSGYYKSVISKAETALETAQPWDRSSPQIRIGIAEDNLELFGVCTLPENDPALIGELTGLFQHRVEYKNRRHYSRETIHRAHGYLEALSRYHVAGNNIKQP